jgi:hypothetical protein
MPYFIFCPLSQREATLAAQQAIALQKKLETQELLPSSPSSLEAHSEVPNVGSSPTPDPSSAPIHAITPAQITKDTEMASSDVQKSNSESAADTHQPTFKIAPVEFSPNSFMIHPEQLENIIREGGKWPSDTPIQWLASDVDMNIALKDEAIARELSTFVIKTMLPSLTLEVLTGECAVLGGEQLVEALHARGINLRYIGQLAELANEEEARDKVTLAAGKTRVQTMPQFWLELLEVSL